jgi:hypothetical protein
MLCTIAVPKLLMYPAQQDSITCGAESNYLHLQCPRVLRTHLEKKVVK